MIIITEQQKSNFLKKFKQGTPEECWEWFGAKNRQGYGEFNLDGFTARAHRISYEIFNGEIPEGMCVLHKCDNRGCVNPNHLFDGTHKNNTQDMIDKGRCGSSKLTNRQVKEIRDSNFTQTKLAKQFNISQAQISNIKNFRRWSS